MSVLTVGLSHRTAPVEVLEGVALDQDAVAKILDELPTSNHLAEAVVVATCNRLELYADTATFHGGVDEASTLLSAHTGVPVEQLTPYLYVHYGERAVSHLFHVVSGLDSMVVGETQILGQVRDAFRLAQTSGATGRGLTELFQTALRVGKRAHAETGIDDAGRSLVTLGLARVMPSVAVEGWAAGRLGGATWRELVRGTRALVIGAGSMAALAATTLQREGADVVVANRTPERAERLAASVSGRAVPMSGVPDALDDVDLVVSCTGATGVVLPYELVEQAAARRGGRPLGVVDLALPRDVDGDVGDLPGVVLADLSRLSEAADDDVADASSLAHDVDAVRAIVTEEVAGYATARRVAQVAPTVVALRTMADDVVDAELSRMAGRLPDLDERSRAEVSTTVRRVVDKLLHAPTVRVKELAAEPDGASYEAALRELFALDRRSIDAVARPDQGAQDGRDA
ncbi:glutamyl-tRNA reductase [Haloactinopolyspora alba]|uniref:Glutamyl-tRNA reductase n=1 Tax=Haloactinopolyspora alba TaxID=648780 RepID=A0A2P8DGQ2_9ACTN|nr:glutamyl-tRNA reductase [Haloactinopolyspora alba]PSK96395.1 glutamyl-tRNA reductase [Haloactinopolyspora alba]